MNLSHEDMCRLSRLFNERADLSGQQDYRINEWLKEQIAKAYSPAPVPRPQGGEDVVERAIEVVKARFLTNNPMNDWQVVRQTIKALAEAGLLSTERERGLEEVWSSDWTKAPKNEKLFLVKYPNGNVTTAYFYWYVEDEIESFKRVEFWALQDANIDMPIDDNGQPEDQGLMWRPML